MRKKISSSLIPASISVIVTVVVAVAMPNSVIYLALSAVLVFFAGLLANFWNNNSELTDNFSNQLQVKNYNSNPNEKNGKDLSKKIDNYLSSQKADEENTKNRLFGRQQVFFQHQEPSQEEETPKLNQDVEKPQP